MPSTSSRREFERLVWPESEVFPKALSDLLELLFRESHNLMIWRWLWHRPLDGVIRKVSGCAAPDAVDCP